MTELLRQRFPIGASVTHAEFEDDPYPVYRRLREREPVSWVPVHDMYFVTRYDLCQSILMDDERFVVGFPHSTVYDILGPHMMSTEGKEARRYKNAHRRPFLPQAIKELEERIRSHADALIDGFANASEVELRRAFASRLPILVMLDLFGLPASDEAAFRGWYDSFEKALANAVWDDAVRAEGKAAVTRFHAHMQAAVDDVRREARPGTLLSNLVHAPADERLTDAEICHNASIVLFGGISTVEALVLNAIYALSLHRSEMIRVTAAPTQLPAVVEETIRWMGPVQSAHRHVVCDTEVAGILLPAGATVSCVLGAANHDPEIFPGPERFDPGRASAKHLGFAVGPHTCLGMHLARTEAKIALERLLARLPGCRMDPVRPARPHGAEFRQPKSLWTIWGQHAHAL